MSKPFNQLQKLGFVEEFVEDKQESGIYVFTEWERNFIKSVVQQEKTKGFLSDKQWAIVHKCFAKLETTFPEAFDDPDEDPGTVPVDVFISHNPHRSYSQEADDDPPF